MINRGEDISTELIGGGCMINLKRRRVIIAAILCVGIAGYLLVSHYLNPAVSVAVIGGSDGPTVIYLKDERGNENSIQPQSLIVPEGDSLASRFRMPEGFERVPVEEGSYQDWLRNLPLKADGAPVLLFDGREKAAQVHEAVIAMDIGSRDLQQCADAAIRLRAEYLYQSGNQDKIGFNFTNGFRADYKSWRSGKRIHVSGNTVIWTEGGTASDTYDTFRSYLDTVFAYAGTLSLSKELKSVPLETLQAGDVFIQGGSPGHCVIVMDVGQNQAGEKCFMLAQSYMPAQEIHILKNNGRSEESPWYRPNEEDDLETPQWTFSWDDLGHFQ